MIRDTKPASDACAAIGAARHESANRLRARAERMRLLPDLRAQLLKQADIDDADAAWWLFHARPQDEAKPVSPEAERDIHPCLASASRWRQEVNNLREHATADHLTPEQRAALAMQAIAADRQAEWWIAGAFETG